MLTLRGSTMKKLLIALAGAACLFTQLPAKADQLQDIEKRGTIRIAVPQDFPPFGSVGTDLQPQGYDIDGVFGPKGAELKDAAALSGKTIGVTRGAVEDMVLTGLAPKDADVKRYEDNNTTLSAYLSGQVQYVATGNLVVAAISRQNADKAPVPSFMLKDSPCFIGLKKNEPALKAKVDALIEQGIKDGTLNGLSEQWLKAPLPANLGA